jgi:ferric-dicitrate binding protein FerR (iron transport regulator)
VGALAVLLMVAVGAAWIWRQPVAVTAPPGQQRTATLPDGSTVDLNSGTTLTYRRGFATWPFLEADRRRVRLDGEAFFSVNEEARPFVVATANARVVVAGTRFNVRARTAVDSTTAVTLTEGRVVVQSRRARQAVVLDQEGQTTRVRDAQARPAPPHVTELDPVLAWRQNGFAVTETPLSVVVRELEQRYATSLRIHRSVVRTKAPLTLYYPTPTSLNTILRDLCTALDLNYRPTSRGYEIFAGPNTR